MPATGSSLGTIAQVPLGGLVPLVTHAVAQLPARWGQPVAVIAFGHPAQVPATPHRRMLAIDGRSGPVVVAAHPLHLAPAAPGPPGTALPMWDLVGNRVDDTYAAVAVVGDWMVDRGRLHPAIRPAHDRQLVAVRSGLVADRLGRIAGIGDVADTGTRTFTLPADVVATVATGDALKSTTAYFDITRGLLGLPGRPRTLRPWAALAARWVVEVDRHAQTHRTISPAAAEQLAALRPDILTSAGHAWTAGGWADAGRVILAAAERLGEPMPAPGWWDAQALVNLACADLARHEGIRLPGGSVDSLIDWVLDRADHVVAAGPSWFSDTARTVIAQARAAAPLEPAGLPLPAGLPSP